MFLTVLLVLRTPTTGRACDKQFLSSGRGGVLWAQRPNHCDSDSQRVGHLRRMIQIWYDWDDASPRLYAAALTIKLSILFYMHMTHLYTYGAHSKSIQFDLNGSGLDDQVDQFCTTLGHCTTVAPHRHVLLYTSGLAWLATITWECGERCHSGIHITHTYMIYIYTFIYIHIYDYICICIWELSKRSMKGGSFA